MLRTLHFTNSWHPKSGGIGTFYKALLQSANDIPWHARLVVPSSETRFEAVGRYGGIYHVKSPSAPFSPEYRVLYPHRYLLPGSPLREILRQEQPHVVEINDKYTLLYLGGLLRIGRIPEMKHLPAVVGIACERMDETLKAYISVSGLARWFARAYMKNLYFPQFDHHVAVSQHVAAELETASKGHKVVRGVWIRGMGVDTERFTPARRDPAKRKALLAEYGVNDNTIALLYAGRLAPEKNLGLLLATLDETSRQSPDADVKLLIAGDGPGRDEFLSEMQQRAPGRFHYLGHVSARDRLADLYANVDAFLHPNPREPFGIAPLEAMAAGVALVAPDSGGVLSYANIDNAWIVPPTGPSFAAAVLESHTNGSERQRRTANARDKAVQLNWPSACASYHQLYESLWARTSRHEVDERVQPAFHSTLGNWLGCEIDGSQTQQRQSR
jgi:glycosyltransferase involved in cell wall biosynthesis